MHLSQLRKAYIWVGFDRAPAPDSCRFPRAGGRVKGRVAPAERRRRRP